MKYQITFGVDQLPFSHDVLGPYMHNGAIVFDCPEHLDTPDNQFLGLDMVQLREQVLFPELRVYHGDFEPPRANFLGMINHVKKALFDAFIHSYCTPHDIHSMRVGFETIARPIELFGHFCDRAGVPDRLHNEMLKLLPQVQGCRRPKLRLGEQFAFHEEKLKEAAKGGGIILDAGDIDEESTDQRDIIMHHVAHRGLMTLIVGVGHSGKSTHALTIGTAIALDKDYGPYRLRERGARVLVLNRENDKTEQELRLGAAVRSLGATVADVKGRLFLWLGSEGPLAQKQKEGIVPGSFEADLRLKIKKLGIDVVIIDPLIDFHAGLSENDNADQHALARIAIKVATDLKCALIISHHATKNAVPDYNKAARGGSALPYASRLGVLLRTRGDGTVTVRNGKWTGETQLPDTDWKFVKYVMPTGQVGMAMEPAQESPWAWAHREALLAMIADEGPWTVAMNAAEGTIDKVAADRFGCSPELVRGYLKAYLAEGMVKAVDGKVLKYNGKQRRTKVWAINPDYVDEADPELLEQVD